jgi:hypothetical protein
MSSAESVKLYLYCSCESEALMKLDCTALFRGPNDISRSQV